MDPVFFGLMVAIESSYFVLDRGPEYSKSANEKAQISSLLYLTGRWADPRKGKERKRRVFT